MGLKRTATMKSWKYLFYSNFKSNIFYRWKKIKIKSCNCCMKSAPQYHISVPPLSPTVVRNTQVAPRQNKVAEILFIYLASQIVFFNILFAGLHSLYRVHFLLHATQSLQTFRSPYGLAFLALFTVCFGILGLLCTSNTGHRSAWTEAMGPYSHQILTKIFCWLYDGA